MVISFRIPYKGDAWCAFFILVITAGFLSAGCGVADGIQPELSGNKEDLFEGVFAPVEYHHSEMDVTAESIGSYRQATGKDLDFAIFSHEWSMNRDFPATQADMIHKNGMVPYIRLMFRSSNRHYQPEPVFTLSRIIQGAYDKEIREWAREAKGRVYPILAEFGTEVNGWWFSWNGYWTGSVNGPERYTEAYRHIIDIFREEGADNVFWVYHVNWNSVPDEPWNDIRSYYPGDEYIDLLAVSAYGALTPDSQTGKPFREMMDFAYPALVNLSPETPILVTEMGTDIRNSQTDPVFWTNAAFSDLFSGRWPYIAGYAWWNAAWPNDANPVHNTTMRIEDSGMLREVFWDWNKERKPDDWNGEPRQA